MYIVQRHFRRRLRYEKNSRRSGPQMLLGLGNGRRYDDGKIRNDSTTKRRKKLLQFESRQRARGERRAGASVSSAVVSLAKTRQKYLQVERVVRGGWRVALAPTMTSGQYVIGLHPCVGSGDI